MSEAARASVPRPTAGPDAGACCAAPTGRRDSSNPVFGLVGARRAVCVVPLESGDDGHRFVLIIGAGGTWGVVTDGTHRPLCRSRVPSCDTA